MLSGKFEDEEGEEEYIPRGIEGPGTYPYDSEISSDIFIGPAVEGDYVRLQG